MAVYEPHMIVKMTALPMKVLFLSSFLYIAMPNRFFDCFTNATEDGGFLGLSLKKRSRSAQTHVITQL